MRKYTKIFLIIMSLGIIVIGCSKDKAQKRVESGSVEKNSTHQLYACPMHPYQVSTEPGECPECGMKLEKIDVNKHSEMMKNMMQADNQGEGMPMKASKDTECFMNKAGAAENEVNSDSGDMGNMNCCPTNQKSSSMGHKLYACPMHPQEVSIKPGKCPECGMDLKEISIEDYKKRTQN